MPESEQVGSDASTQRRNPSASAAHDGVIEATAEQLIGHSVPLPNEHPVRAILSQVAEHEAETWAGEHVSPHVARLPALPAWLDSTVPPHPPKDPRANVALQKMPNVLMGLLPLDVVTICGDQTSALSPLSDLTDRPPPLDLAHTAPHERRR